MILGAAAVMIYGRLNFIPSGVSNRLVDYAVAIAVSPLLLCALWTALKCLRWLALSLWAGAIDIVAAPTTLTFRLGPFGHRTFRIADLESRDSAAESRGVRFRARAAPISSREPIPSVR